MRKFHICAWNPHTSMNSGSFNDLYLATWTSPGEVTEAGREFTVMRSLLSSKKMGSWTETWSSAFRLILFLSLELVTPAWSKCGLLLTTLVLLGVMCCCLLSGSKFLVMYVFLCNEGKMGCAMIRAGFLWISCCCPHDPSARILFRRRDVLASNHAAGSNGTSRWWWWSALIGAAAGSHDDDDFTDDGAVVVALVDAWLFRICASCITTCEYRKNIRGHTIFIAAQNLSLTCSKQLPDTYLEGILTEFGKLCRSSRKEFQRLWIS